MAPRILTLAIIAGLLAGCSTVRDSRINPLNWFGGSREAAAPQQARSNPLIPARSGGSGLFSRPEQSYPGIAIDRITDMRVEQTLGGAIVHVTGIAARQGAFDVRLTPANEDETPIDGILSYRFDVVYPEQATIVGPEATRRIIAARTLSHEQLAAVRVIRIEALENARESRRR